MTVSRGVPSGVPLVVPQVVPLVVPLVVDVDGTLIKTDLLHEAALQLVATNPLQTWRLVPWLLQGKAALKARLADSVDAGAASVPLREEVVAVIQSAQADGRDVWLASASDRRWVETIAARVPGIAGVFASDGRSNLAGGNKAAALVAAFGEGGFDYIGDHAVDLPVWAAARGQLLVGHKAALERRVKARFPDVQVIARPRSSLRAHVRALRIHQWAKNLLVFLPVVAGHSFGDPAAVLAAIIAFFAFSFAASSAYMVNDLLDLPGDRDHPRKCRRPFASGELSATRGLAMGAVLMLAALGLAALLAPLFFGVLCSYVAMTLAYSFYLKRRLLIDIMVLGGLYTIRVLGGVAALQQAPSTWLLMFSLFLFLSLAIVKRCAELVARVEAGKPAPPGRAYVASDLTALFPLGAASGCSAVLVVALYLSSPDVAAMYAHPTRMWLMCPLLLYWISRTLMFASRNEMHDDPVIFALTDRVSWITGLVAAAIIAVSI